MSYGLEMRTCSYFVIVAFEMSILDIACEVCVRVILNTLINCPFKFDYYYYILMIVSDCL
jgi:hypothetical protein